MACIAGFQLHLEKSTNQSFIKNIFIQGLSKKAEIVRHIIGETTEMDSVSHQLSPFLKRVHLLLPNTAICSLLISAVSYGMKQHKVISLLIRHCVIGDTPAYKAELACAPIEIILIFFWQ